MSQLKIMSSIDTAAETFYRTQCSKDANIFMTYVAPVVKSFVNRKCAGSRWDADELYSILLTDMWRLLQSWAPKENKKFHWLMFRQLRNKTINFIHYVEGNPHKICPTCNARQSAPKPFCNVCKSSLKISDRVMENSKEKEIPQDYLEDLANKELVEKLLKGVENDPRTLRIVQLLLEGYSKGDVSNQVGIAQNAINNRIKKCRKIIERLSKEEKI